MTPGRDGANLPGASPMAASLGCAGLSTTRCAPPSIRRPRSAASDARPTSASGSSLRLSCPFSWERPSLGPVTPIRQPFARSGVDGKTYRLDQHAPMRDHPVTPSGESDLRLHLSPNRLPRRSSSFDILAARGPQGEIQKNGLKAVLERRHRRSCSSTCSSKISSPYLGEGCILESGESRNLPLLFVVGSSGVESALTAAVAGAGPARWTQAPQDRYERCAARSSRWTLAVSGSCFAG